MSYHFQYVVFKVHAIKKLFSSFPWHSRICDSLVHGHFANAANVPPRLLQASLLTVSFHCLRFQKAFVEITRFELVTSCLQGRRSPN